MAHFRTELVHECPIAFYGLRGSFIDYLSHSFVGRHPLGAFFTLQRVVLVHRQSERWGLGLRSFSSQAASNAGAKTQPTPPPPSPEETHFGGLKDKDRIFTNLYGLRDPFLEGAMKRAAQSSTASVICRLLLEVEFRDAVERNSGFGDLMMGNEKGNNNTSGFRGMA